MLLGTPPPSPHFRALLGDQEVAVKRFVCDSLRADEAYGYVREIAVLSNLLHPNVIQLFGVSVSPPFMVHSTTRRPQTHNLLACSHLAPALSAQCLVMEYSSIGSLYDVLTRERRYRRAVRRARRVLLWRAVGAC